MIDASEITAALRAAGAERLPPGPKTWLVRRVDEYGYDEDLHNLGGLLSAEVGAKPQRATLVHSKKRPKRHHRHHHHPRRPYPQGQSQWQGDGGGQSPAPEQDTSQPEAFDSAEAPDVNVTVMAPEQAEAAQQLDATAEQYAPEEAAAPEQEQADTSGLERFFSLAAGACALVGVAQRAGARYPREAPPPIVGHVDERGLWRLQEPCGVGFCCLGVESAEVGGAADTAKVVGAGVAAAAAAAGAIYGATKLADKLKAKAKVPAPAPKSETKVSTPVPVPVPAPKAKSYSEGQHVWAQACPECSWSGATIQSTTATTAFVKWDDGTPDASVPLSQVRDKEPGTAGAGADDVGWVLFQGPSDEAKETFRLLRADWEAYEREGVGTKILPHLRTDLEEWRKFRDAWLFSDLIPGGQHPYLESPVDVAPKLNAEVAQANRVRAELVEFKTKKFTAPVDLPPDQVRRGVDIEHEHPWAVSIDNWAKNTPAVSWLTDPKQSPLQASRRILGAAAVALAGVAVLMWGLNRRPSVVVVK